MLFINPIMSPCSSTLVCSFFMWPSCRITGGWPTVRCKSLAPLLDHRVQQLVNQNDVGRICGRRHDESLFPCACYHTPAFPLAGFRGRLLRWDRSLRRILRIPLPIDGNPSTRKPRFNRDIPGVFRTRELGCVCAVGWAKWRRRPSGCPDQYLSERIRKLPLPPGEGWGEGAAPSTSFRIGS